MPKEHRRNHGGGFLYVIRNPAWPGYCKLGRSTNVSARLRTYQTAAPLRDYVLHHSRYFPDVCRAERTMKQRYTGVHANGEWYHIHPDDAADLVDALYDDHRGHA